MKYPVSVITINYNNAKGLEQTIASVCQQKLEPIEYIVIDGGSTDGSVALIEQASDQIEYWVSEPDEGIYHAMNKGIAKAQGEYLLFLNSGDVLTSPQALSDFMSHPLFKGDIIYGDYLFADGEKRYPDHLPPWYFMKTSLPHQSTLFKRSVFERMGGYDTSYAIAADRAFYLQCFLTEDIVFTHLPYFLTLFDRSGLSNDPAYITQKKAEDERLLRTLYGDDYEAHKAAVIAEQRANRAKRNTVTGLLKRVLNKWRRS
ncbi:glycosyltransferase family 2 protein [Altibacter sp.]|uniref:glycosyltransferase family 2 protein n=1 Tax=Altibacter sp. TaxID=2024823 RepID=UPI0025B9FB4E|nr:glycosyltransferase family 2 protein [Altibacter sp.]